MQQLPRRRGLIGITFGLLAVATTGAALWRVLSAESRAAEMVATRPVPELPRRDAADWINSPPLSLAALRGKPVLIEFWTFGCSNCRNTLPWLERVYDRFASRGLTIIAVHSPEFDRERPRDAVTSAVQELGIRYPVMLDNDFAYWNALGNRYWPAFYLLDGDGRLVATRIGELHAGRASADEFERAVERMLPPRQ